MKSATAPRPGARNSNKMSVITILSYVLDWIILIAVGVTGVILGDITPNMRPFSLQDPNISYVLLILAVSLRARFPGTTNTRLAFPLFFEN